MINSTKNNADISMNSQKGEAVTSFKYLDANLCKDGTCSAEIHIRIASAMAVKARLNRIWQSKLRFYQSLSLVVSIILFRHGPCLLTLRKGSKLLKPSARGNFSGSLTWSTRPMTERRARSTSLWPHRNLFWQLQRDGNSLTQSGHVTCYNSLSKAILWATKVSGQHHGQQRKCWLDNVKQWTCIPARTAHNCLPQKRLEENVLNHSSCPPTTQVVKGLS